MECISQKITFSLLVSELDRINKITNRPEKTKQLTDVFKNFRNIAFSLKQTAPNAQISLFPIVRLLVPDLDRDRGPYHFRKTQFSHIIASVLPLSIEDKKFVNGNWKKQGFSGSYADMVSFIVQKYAKTGSGLTLLEVNNHLDSLANANRDEQKEILKNIFTKFSPLELKWLVKILMKNLSLSIHTKDILNALHPDAFNLYIVNNNLQQVCNELRDISVRITIKEVQVGSPFKPMLCQRCSAKELLNLKFQEHSYIIQEKHDGERFQLHKLKDKYTYFSRNAFDYTETFGENYNQGILTPHLETIIDKSVDSVILDGEMMGWNPVTKEYTCKGIKFDVKKLKEDRKYKAVFIVYDIVHLNGNDLLNNTQEERLKILTSIIKPKEGVLMLSEVKYVTNINEIINALNSAIDMDQEGIVIKDPFSTYKPTARNGGWFKLKIEYFSNTMHDLDVVIVGGFYNEKNKQNSRICSYLTAIIKRDVLKGETSFLSFSRVSSGLSDEEKMQLELKIKNHWVLVKDNLPTHLDNLVIKWGTQKPDVVISPKNSVVLEIRGTELLKDAKDFATSYTVRFPRIQNVRFDKPYDEILTMSELQCLTQDGKVVQKLGKRHLNMKDIILTKSTKRARPNQYVAPKMQDIKVKTNVLSGHEFFVLSDLADYKKEIIEKDIIENGGKIVHFARISTDCILYGDHHPLLDCYKGDKDIVKLEWLRNVLNKQEYSPYSSVYVFYRGKLTRKNVDEYGDDYIIRSDATEMAKILENMENQKHCMRYKHLLELRIEEDEYKLKYAELRAYFDRYKIPNNKQSDLIYPTYFAEMNFLAQGGTVSEVLDVTVNLIVLEHIDETRAKFLLDFVSKEYKTKPYVICEGQIDNIM